MLAGCWCLGWHNRWVVSKHVVSVFARHSSFLPLHSVESVGTDMASWSLATVYGPMDEGLKLDFLDEIRAISADCVRPLLIRGDFNQIYQAADKNNSKLNLRLMRRFRHALDDIGVDELFLHGRLYTWSNERRPTMERIDRAFANLQWLE